MSDKTLVVYGFNKDSIHKEFTGEVILSEEKGDLSPLDTEEDVWLIPSDCVPVAPMLPATNRIRVYTGNGINEHSWELILDYKGQEYWDTNGVKQTILDYGVDFPAGASLTEPPPSLDKLKAEKAKELLAKVEGAIVVGFKSDALGSIHWYGSNAIDQMNLTANYASAVNAIDPEWKTQQLCGDGTAYAEGSWVYRDHNKAQMIQVGETGKARILTLLVRHNLAQQALASLETNTEQKIAAIDFDIVVEGQ